MLFLTLCQGYSMYSCLPLFHTIGLANNSALWKLFTSGGQVVIQQSRWSSLHYSIFISFFSFSYSRLCYKALSFLSMTLYLFEKVPVKKESSHSVSRTILFLALFAQIYIFGQHHNLSWSCDTVSSINLLLNCTKMSKNKLGLV